MSMVKVDTNLNKMQSDLHKMAIALEDWLADNSYYDSKTARAVDLLLEAIKEYTE